ncbi:MAG: hypothetical protein JSV09_10670 [Thermoplasmata archaeon]|nr:MAG: hypothetical protein JSV09_10670 [Thermoplasmata archaeon]
MRRFIAIFGPLLIMVILICGSAVAQSWHYALDYSETNCTNPEEALYAPDSSYATIGENPSTLGSITLDLGAANEMGPSQNFTVYGYLAGITEKYTVWVIEGSSEGGTVGIVGHGQDTNDEEFYTPATLGKTWRYIMINGTSGSTGVGDTIYGPEIDAVGWYG